MPTAKQTGCSLADYEQALVWGAWGQLGVSTWQRNHDDWTVDPEPLIIYTAALRDVDPRLRDEALDWCIHYGRYVSKVRLRNLLRDQSPDVLDAWGPFAATVGKHTGSPWPQATHPFAYGSTGRSSLGSMEQPSRGWLRLRAMFGLGARTEILRYFLSGHRRATVATIAESVGYAKRNVADECYSLERAGVLRVQRVQNRFHYALARREALRGWVGDIGAVQPDWTSLFRMTCMLVELESKAKTLSDEALSIEAHRVARLLDDELDKLGIEDRPPLVRRDNYWPPLRDFAHKYMEAWAAGEWEPVGTLTEVVGPRRVLRRPGAVARSAGGADTA